MKNLQKRFVITICAIMLAGAGCISLNESGVRTTGPGGMFVSVNKGESWQSISVLPEPDGVKNISDSSVYRLFTDPTDPTALYWATRKSGYYYSYNEGRSWQKPMGDLATGLIFSITVHPSDRCTIYASNGYKVYKTEDCSRSWQEVYQEGRLDVSVTSVVFDPFQPRNLLLSTSNGDVLRSTDTGVSWQVLHRLNVFSGQLFADPHQPDTYYLASRENGLYRSLNGGVNWASLQPNMDDFSGSSEYRRFMVHPEKSGVLYWVSTYGILVSQDGGDSWSALELITPPGSAQIYGFAVNPRNDREIYYTATINDRSTFYKSDDGGATWITKRLPSDQLPTVLYVHPTKEDIVYLGFTILPIE